MTARRAAGRAVRNDPWARRRHAWRVGRPELQQEERPYEHAAAEHGGDAQAPPLSALFPQGSTLLRGQCTRADAPSARGTAPNLGTHRDLRK